MASPAGLTASASQLAFRVKTLSGDNASPVKKIETAYRLTLSRSPSPTEIKVAEEYLQHLKQLYEASSIQPLNASKRSFDNFVHMLLCSNEFLYLD